MKKVFLSLSLALMSTWGFAQESMEAFKHVGIGAEVGLMGFGAQVAIPVVTDHLVLVAGYNFYGVKPASHDFKFSSGELNTEITKMYNKYLTDINKYNAHDDGRTKLELNTNSCLMPSKFDITGKAQLAGNAKVLLEYYPSKKSNFHIVAGLMIGNEEFVKIKGLADDELSAKYDLALEVQNNLKKDGEMPQHENYVRGYLNYNLDETTYSIQDKLEIDIRLKVMKVKPYVGIGWGHSVPRSRVGFQFEIGAWYHGKPQFVSDNEDEFNPEADGIEGFTEVLNKIQFWPQMTFRLTGRLF